MKCFPAVLRHVLPAALVVGALAGNDAFAQATSSGTPLPAFLQYDNGDTRQLVVKFRDDPKQRGAISRDAVLYSAAATLVARNAPVTLAVQRDLAVGAAVVRSSRMLKRVEADALVHALSNDPAVEYAVIDEKVYPASDDTHWSRQWGMHGGTGVGIESAWPYSLGDGIVVAVLDTGSLFHPDIDSQRLPGYDFMSDLESSQDGDGRDPDPIASDNCAHGLQVESVVAAVAGNRMGIAGTAPRAKVVPIRVTSCFWGSVSDIAEAIMWASGSPVPGVPLNQNPAEVINLSLGTRTQSGCSPVYQAAIDIAVSRGSVVVAAAGNWHGDDVSTFQPATCDKVIAVGSTNKRGGIAGHSNVGVGVDLWAPGEDIYLPDHAGGYIERRGTSFAAPVVSGTVALVQSLAASVTAMTPAEIEETLKSTARVTGFGGRMIDPTAAVQFLPANRVPHEPMQMALNGHAQSCLQSSGSSGPGKRAECSKVGSNQMWWFQPAGGGAYRIVGKRGECLDVAGSSAAPGARVMEWPCNGGTSQRWEVAVQSRDLGRHVAILKNQSSGKCLTLEDGLAAQMPCSGGNSRWTMLEWAHRLPQQQSFNTLQAASGGLCVTHDDNWVTLKAGCDTPDSGLRLQAMDTWGDVFRLVTKDPARCASIELSPDFSHFAVIRPCSSAKPQQWKLEQAGGHWQLRNMDYRAACLTPQNDAMTAGTKLVVWPCTHVSDNARWTLVNL